MNQVQGFNARLFSGKSHPNSLPSQSIGVEREQQSDADYNSKGDRRVQGLNERSFQQFPL